jgi:acyl-CoA dehydrogenase
LTLPPARARQRRRHHRRYRITEGTEEIQMRRVAGYLFGLIKRDTLKGVTG